MVIMGISNKRIRPLSLLPMIILFFMTICSIVAEADPIPIGGPYPKLAPPGYPDFLSGVIWTAILNYAVNLFFFQLFFSLVASKYGKDVGKIPASRKRFFALIFITVLAISLIGAIIDMVFLSGYDSTYGEYRLFYDRTNLLIAATLVSISIVLTGIFMMRIRLRPILIIAFGMMFVNFFFWLLILNFGETVALSGLFLSLVFVAFVEKYLFYWHRDVFSQPPDEIAVDET